MKAIEELIDILLMLLPFLWIYLVILLIVFIISLFFIFEKCYKKGYYALIPFFNIYEYMEICHLSWYWGFIPVVNVVVFFASPYLIGYQFGQKEYVRILGIICPVVFFPYIAFSNASYIHPKVDSLNINSVEDIDNLEKKIMIDIENEERNGLLKKENIKVNKKDNVAPQESQKEIWLNQLDSNYSNLAQDDVIVEDVVRINNDIALEQTKIYADADFVELDDFNYDLNVDSIKVVNEIEKNTIMQGKEIAIDNNDYKEIKDEEKTNEEIAFDQKEKRQLVCPKCGSSLIGATSICPGCGMDLKQTI